MRFPDVTPRRSVVGAHTEPGTGYGMIAYAANPGMLTGVRRGRVDLDRIALAGGGTYAGGVVVSAENAHPGHVVHDLLPWCRSRSSATGACVSS
ncbi:MAG: hypothetical protein HYS77_05155, partial [Candidatus Rokubacteria bacterium]|nr:hypothetical protein [Candidatus Rokubacteria bacterium]